MLDSPPASGTSPAVEDRFASADMPADVARSWLTEYFDQQVMRGESGALADGERESLRTLLGIAWWDAAVSEETGSDPAAMMSDVLPAAVRATASSEEASAVFALYLRNVVNAAWALAWDHRLLREALSIVRGAVGEFNPPGLLSAASCAWRLLDFLQHEFDVESAVLTGRIGAVDRIADDAVQEIALIVGDVGALPPTPASAALVREAANELTYYTTVRDTARVIQRLLTRGTDDASEEIARIRTNVGAAALNPMDASELRGHLAAADAIQAATAFDWIHVDDGRVRIVYPFSIPTEGRADPSIVIDVVRRAASASQLGTAPEGLAATLLGPLRIVEVVERLDLGDVWWQGSDSLGRGYRGATIRLEPMLFERLSSGDEPVLLDEISTRVQLSELGNHVVSFDIAVRDAGAYRLAEIVNLATPVFGDLTEIDTHLRLRPAGAPKDDPGVISRLAAVVSGILGDIAVMLDADEDCPVEGDAVSAREGSFGTMATIERASKVAPDGTRTELLSAPEIMSLWGVQPLVHPLPSGAASVADWAIHDVATVDTYRLLHLNNEILAANANVTLLASFHSPSYAVAEIETFVEFAHSLHGMYQGWQSRVRDHAETVAALLDEVRHDLNNATAPPADGASDAREAAIGRLGSLVQRIEIAELNLQAFVQSNEAIILFIESPAIVTSPPLRRDLDEVLRSNHYTDLRNGFEKAVREVLGSRLQPLLDVVHRRIEAEYSAEREEQRAAHEDRLQAIVAISGVVLAVVGLSGLASLLQSAYGWRGDNVWWLVAGILMLAAATGAALAVLAWRAGRRARRRDAALRTATRTEPPR